ncbi:hypothetical protein IE077_004009 [Cardiosporidium cionae]|uniref:Uncharacterized protein n=1 Tax=Cardiosporidium cionae TaxID=476202 RepID=A0ABQ7J725_9APIC|nr:hypothetical protein IE077_004009 [Cardiosporidium cionae]|eukprot:KAF8819787.1 hypothetical protein IE077_004009 [Cardiosporidium cionae]
MKELRREPTLQHASTADIISPPIKKLDSEMIQATTKAPQEIIDQMKVWLRTGIAPDGTQMLTSQVQDVYHGTTHDDPNYESLPEGAHTDYYYWSCPYRSHIGDINLIMMHAQVNFRDQTHMPADRLQEKTRKGKNLLVKAKKLREIEERERRVLLNRAMDRGAHRGHPLRKEGIYTKYFWRPFLKQASYTSPVILEGEEEI